MKYETGIAKTNLIVILIVIVVIAIGAGAYFLMQGTEEGPGGGEKTIEKAGLIAVADETDMSWAKGIVDGAEHIETKWGIETEVNTWTAYADAEGVLEGFAQRDYDLIWGHGGEYGDSVIKVAKQYPESYFVAYSVAETPPVNNCMSLMPDLHEPYFIGGVLAAYLTETEKIAYMAGEEYPLQTRDYVAYKKGAKAVNPDVEVFKVVIGSWTDAGLGETLASDLISQKNVDIIAHEADAAGRGVTTACKEAGVPMFGTFSDESPLAPNWYFSSSVMNCGAQLDRIIEIANNGNFEEKLGGQEYHAWGYEENAVSLAPFHRFSQHIDDSVEEYCHNLEDRIATGELDIPTKLEDVREWEPPELDFPADINSEVEGDQIPEP